MSSRAAPTISPGPTHRVAGLGHVGLRAWDPARLAEFYQDALGLHLTDYEPDLQMWFLSARPELEHHELLITGGRTSPADAALIQQISFRCAELGDVTAIYRWLVSHEVPLSRTVTHGIAVGCYFFDPEANIVEVYWPTGLDAQQPFNVSVDLDMGEDEISELVRRAVAEHGETGFVEERYSAGHLAGEPPRMP